MDQNHSRSRLYGEYRNIPSKTRTQKLKNKNYFTRRIYGRMREKRCTLGLLALDEL